MNHSSTARGYVIRPSVPQSRDERVQELREFLAANIDTAIADGALEKAAVFQQHLDTVDELARVAGGQI